MNELDSNFYIFSFSLPVLHCKPSVCSSEGQKVRLDLLLLMGSDVLTIASPLTAECIQVLLPNCHQLKDVILVEALHVFCINTKQKFSI